MDWGRKWLIDFNAGKTQFVSFDQSNNSGATDVKMDGSVLEEKSSSKTLGLTFSSKLDWGSYIISIQEFIQAILMSRRRPKKLNLITEFSNSIFIKFYFKAHCH